MTHRERMEDLVVAERAAEWLQRLEHGGPEVHAEFARWLRESPRHIREVLLAGAIRHAVRDLSSVHPSIVAEIKSRVAGSVVELDLPEPRATTSNRVRGAWARLMSIASGWHRSAGRGAWRLATAFALVVMFSFVVIAIYAVADRSITTAAGEWRNIPLDDGSLLRAGPRTKVYVEMNDHRRLVRLAYGEVMVRVARDRARPFYVETDVATARAVGTAFAMRRVEPGRASVTVQEGIVAVARGRAPVSNNLSHGAVKVKAGEAVTVTNDGQAVIPHAADMARELAWVQQRLVLGANGTIADAIRELNLRNRTQIELLDTTIGERPLRGVFSASDPLTFVEALKKSVPLSVVEEGETVLLIARPDTEKERSRER